MKSNEKVIAVVVTNQIELDKVPSEYTGQVIINGGSRENPIVVKQRYKRTPKAVAQSFVLVKGRGELIASDEATIIAYHYTKIKAYDFVTVYAWHQATVTAHGNCKVIAKNSVKITAFGNCKVQLWDMTKAKARGYVEVLNFGKSKSYLWQNSKAWIMSDTAHAFELEATARVIR